ncbi:MAG TPA: serine/threonine-protein kinase [Nocardioides sp.]|nr:serine/threonine-protein kinase [Nocardioides sp.]
MTLPERLGRLRRVDRIGAGGFATVWLYHDDDLDSPVAVKALADNWAARADVRERFLEEARMLRRADSYHVVRVYDIGEADQTPYFVMSYADRGSLATLTDAGAISADRAVDLIAQAGIGVHVLHQRGIIHRDLKPQNLLLRSGDDDAEEVLVADLGVAKAMLHASGLTQVVGTPAYMAPEQAIGLGIDRRADVHALGAVAYQLMTGQIARHGGIADLASPQRPLAPSEIRPELSAYDDVLLRSMERDPELRWPDVPSFVGALQAARREAASSEYAFLYETPRSANAETVYLQRTALESPAPSGPVTPVADEPAPRRRRRALWVVAACLLVVAAVAGGGYALISANGKDATGAQQPTTGTTAAPTFLISGDVSYPSLDLNLRLPVRHRIVSPGGSVWSYRVPAGWTASILDDSGQALPTAGQQIDQQTEVRWRPPDEPPIGGYSIRFRALEPTFTPWEQLVQRRSLLRNAHYPGFEVYQHTQQAIWFKFVDAEHHLRYNFWRWVPDANGNAGLEISVSGRKQDVDGLDALLSAAAALARPVR